MGFVQSHGKLRTLQWPVGSDYWIIGDDIGNLKLVEMVDSTVRQLQFHRGDIQGVSNHTIPLRSKTNEQMALNPRFSPPLLLSCGTDGTVLLWQLPELTSHTRLLDETIGKQLFHSTHIVMPLQNDRTNPLCLCG